MSKGTRGQLELAGLRKLIGNSKPLSESDLPSFRDILKAILYVIENTYQDVKHSVISHVCNEVTEQVISVYKRANALFEPGKNLIHKKSIVNKMKSE